MTQRVQLEGPNAVRLFAAMAIVPFHLIGMQNLKIPAYLSFIASYGGFGVPLFYIMSAFALSYGYHDRLQSPEQWKSFYIRRFFRISPLFYTMMVIYILFLFFSFGKAVSISEIVASFTYTFNVLPGYTDGFVWASWSIGVEMLFYAIFPLITFIGSSLTKSIILFLISIFIVSLWQSGFSSASQDLKHFANLGFLSHFHYFCAGILTFFIWKKLQRNPINHRIFIFISSLSILILILASPEIQSIYERIFGLKHSKTALTTVLAIIFSLFILGFSFEKFYYRSLAWTSYLGKASLSIYLWHPLVIGCLMLSGVYEKIYANSYSLLLSFCASLALTLLILFPLALLSYHWIEKAFATWLKNLFDALQAGWIRVARALYQSDEINPSYKNISEQKGNSI